MPETSMTAYNFAGQLLRKGIAPTLIEKSLTDQGLGAEAATVVVSNLIQARAKASVWAART
jgi:hypothetical protein